MGPLYEVGLQHLARSLMGLLLIVLPLLNKGYIWSMAETLKAAQRCGSSMTLTDP